MDEVKKLWWAADEALAKARSLPWSLERFEALKEASRLRNDAVKAEMALGATFQRRSEWKDAKPINGLSDEE